MNETSSLVWDACDGNQSVSEISQAIGKKLNSPANEDIVWLALDQLKKEKLIANEKDVVSKFGGMSRREVMKKVGFASMIALPVISSLVAPMAVHATSVCGSLVKEMMTAQTRHVTNVDLQWSDKLVKHNYRGGWHPLNSSCLIV